jgi:hypothetical protein
MVHGGGHASPAPLLAWCPCFLAVTLRGFGEWLLTVLGFP